MQNSLRKKTISPKTFSKNFQKNDSFNLYYLGRECFSDVLFLQLLKS